MHSLSRASTLTSPISFHQGSLTSFVSCDSYYNDDDVVCATVSAGSTALAALAFIVFGIIFHVISVCSLFIVSMGGGSCGVENSYSPPQPPHSHTIVIVCALGDAVCNEQYRVAALRVPGHCQICSRIYSVCVYPADRGRDYCQSLFPSQSVPVFNCWRRCSELRLGVGYLSALGCF